MVSGATAIILLSSPMEPGNTDEHHERDIAARRASDRSEDMNPRGGRLGIYRGNRSTSFVVLSIHRRDYEYTLEDSGGG